MSGWIQAAMQQNTIAIENDFSQVQITNLIGVFLKGHYMKKENSI